MALENLVVCECPQRNFDDTALRLVMAGKGVEKTVNKKTHKKKLLPIIQAVKSGRPEIVEILLNIGANVNLRGETDNQTALNLCVSFIGAVKYPDRFMKRLKQHPVTPELLDGVRRYSNGAMGAILDQQSNLLNPQSELIMQYIREDFKRQVIQQMTLEGMREILKLLLNAGADVNASMQSPLKGYTPLMLAIELDLEYEFSLMIQYNADLDKEFYHPQAKASINCWDLAKHHRAKNILRVLELIRSNYRQ
jgi:ankyrin repeat protein